MKKFLRLFALVATAGFLYFGVTSCEEGANVLLVDVELDYKNLELRIDSGASTNGEIAALDTTISANLDSLIESAGGSPDDIKELFVVGFKMDIVEPDGGTFDAIKAISLQISTAANPNDVIDIVPVGTTIPKGSSSIKVPVTEEDIVRLLEDDTFIIKASISLEDGAEITESILAIGSLDLIAKVAPL